MGIDELDGYALRELVSAIYVDAPDKSSGKRVQHIHIKYDGLGFIPLNELMKKETARPKSRRPLKTQGFHHFLTLLFYDHPANDVTIMKEGHPEAGIPLLVGGPGWN